MKQLHFTSRESTDDLSAAVYKTERTQLGHFLESTKSILHELAGYAKDIENMININPQTSVGIMSRGTRHVILLYHGVRLNSAPKQLGCGS